MNKLMIALIVFASMSAASSRAEEVRKPGATQAFLKQMPLEKIIDLYINHIDAVANPRLREYATFFRTHQPLFDEMIRNEEAATDDNYVFYHGANGPRLIFDTLRAMHNVKQDDAVPADFVLFRDAEDPNVPTEDLWHTLTGRWPPLYADEKKAVLSAMFEQNLSNEQVLLLWNVLWGDLDFSQDLSLEQQLSIAPILKDQFDDHLQVFRALKSYQWQEWLMSDAQRERILGIQQKMQSSGKADILLMMQALDDAFDFDSEFRQRVIAVNLSLFSGCVLRDRKVGLYPSKDECTPLYWFAADLGPHRYEKNQALLRDLLEAIFRRNHIPLDEIDALENIYSGLQPVDDQQLFQIFIPKSVTPDSRGKPQPLIDQLFYLSHKIGRPAYYLDRMRPSEVLETYREDPSQIQGFLQLQGRLLFTKDGLLNTQSGIRVRTYYLPGASQQRIDAYHGQLKQWAKRVLGYWSLSQPQPVAPQRFARARINMG